MSANNKSLQQIFTTSGEVYFPNWENRAAGQTHINMLFRQRVVDRTEYRRITELLSTLCADLSPLPAVPYKRIIP